VRRAGTSSRRPSESAPSRDDFAKVLHEPEVHQVELQTQNEELRRTRGELERGLVRYTRLFDFAPIGYACLGTDGIIREVNHAGAALLGRPRTLLTNEPFGAHIALSDRAAFNVLLDKVIATGSRQGCELRLRRKSGAADGER
jgi:PAS domain-containing protein